MVPGQLLNLPRGTGAKEWLKEIMPDLTSVIEDDPDALRKRNERFGSYLVYLSTLISTYRFKARYESDTFEKENPRPEKGITRWEEVRQSKTAEYRYWEDLLTNLRDDIQRRISNSQTALNYERQQVQTFGATSNE